MYQELSRKTFTASGAISAHTRVKAVAGSTTTPMQVTTAGVGDEYLGVSEYDIADGTVGTIRMRNADGTFEIVADGVIEAGALGYGGANGQVSATVNGNEQFIVLQAATAQGDIVECLPL